MLVSLVLFLASRHISITPTVPPTGTQAISSGGQTVSSGGEMRARVEIPGKTNLRWRANPSLIPELKKVKSRQGTDLLVLENNEFKIFGYPIVWQDTVNFVELVNLDGHWVGQVKKAEAMAK